MSFLSYTPVRAMCGASGIDIGSGLCLFVSAQDNDLGIDAVRPDAEPQIGLPLPAAHEVSLARQVTSAMRRQIELAERDKRIFQSALSEAIGVIEGLEDQQAMADDWYMEKLTYFRALCPAEETT